MPQPESSTDTASIIAIIGSRLGRRKTGRRMVLSVVIMAAGKGTRMRSARPKVLHRLRGKPLLGDVVATAEALAPERCIVVTGHGAEEVEAAFAGQQRVFVRQMPQLGTGHAVQ